MLKWSMHLSTLIDSSDDSRGEVLRRIGLAGLRRISATESSKFARRHPVRCHRQLFLECHKARSLLLGPILFHFYTADLLQLIKRHHLTPHVYAECRRHPDLRSLSAVLR